MTKRGTDEDNAGEITIDTSGNLSFGVGGGLGIDMANGDPTYTMGEITVDLG